MTQGAFFPPFNSVTSGRVALAPVGEDRTCHPSCKERQLLKKGSALTSGVSLCLCLCTK